MSDNNFDLDQAVLDAARSWVNVGYPIADVARAMRKWAGGLELVWREDMVCEVCGKVPERFGWRVGQPMRLGQRYCSNACRQRAYRLRHSGGGSA